MKKTLLPLLLGILFAFSSFSQNQCFQGTDTPLGCLFKCNQLSGVFEDESLNMNQANSNCANDNHTKWISVLAKEESVKITLDTFICGLSTDFSVQVFDKNLIPVVQCEEFDRNSSRHSFTVENLTVGEIYSIGIFYPEVNFCKYNISFEGIETDTLGDIEEVNFIRRDYDSTILEVTPVPGAKNYFWEISPNGQIISGQGSNRVEIQWNTSGNSSVCVTAQSDCKSSRQVCQNSYDQFLTPPCLPVKVGEPAGDSLQSACLACSPVYAGNTGGYTKSPPHDSLFPCGTIENNQFIAIMADASGTLEASIISNNCQNNQGVEAAVYDASFNIVSNCFSSLGTDTVGHISASNLTPGEQYRIMVDGYKGDSCDFLLTIDGCISCGPPEPPGPIYTEPDTFPFCVTMEVLHFIDAINGATTYEWTLPSNAVILEGGGVLDTFVKVKYIAPGGGVVSVVGSNPCFAGIPSIAPFVVIPILPTIKPPEHICSNDFPIVRDGILFNELGTHVVNLQTDLGCDSSVHYIFVPKVQIPTVIDTTICAGESIMIGFDYYDEPISQTISLSPPHQQANGCDSIIVLTINIVNPIADIAAPDQLGCDSGSTVDLDGSASSQGAGVSYFWEADLGGVLIGDINSGFVRAAAPGRYFLTVFQNISSNQTCQSHDTVYVTKPPTFIIGHPVFVQAETYICTGSTATYIVNETPGTDSFQWTVPLGAEIVGSHDKASITIRFDSAESGTVCVSAQMPCGVSPPACIPVTINASVSSEFTLPDSICTNDDAEINYTGNASPFATFNWQLNGGQPEQINGAGPHSVSWDSPGTKTVSLAVDENGCRSTLTSKSIRVDEAIPDLIISCTSTESSIRFDWNAIQNAVYTIQSNGATISSNQSDIFYEFNGLAQGESKEITVIADTGSACPTATASSNCIAQDCPAVSLNITPIPNICVDSLTGSISLSAAPSSGGSGILEWLGTSVSGNVFDPKSATVGNNTIALKYTEGTCVYTESINVNLVNVPTADFEVDSISCRSAPVLVQYTGNASAGAVFNWNFRNGSVLSGMGQGPYEVDFSDFTGKSTISLTVEENGCISPLNAQEIQIDPILAPPTVQCILSTSTSLLFGWAEVPGATNYIVRPTFGSVDIQSRTVEFDGLLPGQEVTIEVTAEGNSICGSSRSSQTCRTNDCPQLQIIIDPVGPFCENDQNSSIQLTATAGDNSGIFTWTGPGVSPNGILDLNSHAVTPGILTIRVTYEKHACSYGGSIDFEIRPNPESDIQAESPVCLDSTASVFHSGYARAGADFQWEFDSGNIISGLGIPDDPYEINWDSAGIYDISLTIDDSNCLSDKTTISIQVDPPLNKPKIVCNTNETRINFNWPIVPGALSYDVVQLYGQSAAFDGSLNYNVTGLNPGDSVAIAVTANGVTACGSVSDTLGCVARNCPDYLLTMPDIDPICANDSIAFIDLMPLLILTSPGGTDLKDSANLRWEDQFGSNDYISIDGKFFPITAEIVFGTGDAPLRLHIEYPKSSGCIQTFETTVRINSAPEFTGEIYPPFWTNSIGGDIDLTVPGNNPGLQFLWSNNETTEDLSNIAPGEYCVTVSDNAGCSTDKCFTVTDGIFRTQPFILMCKGESQQLSVRPNRGADFSWSPSTGLSCNDCSAPIASPSESTVYTITATLSDGRSGSQQVAVLVLPPLFCGMKITKELNEKIAGSFDFSIIDSPKKIFEIEQKVRQLILENSIEISPNPNEGKFSISSFSKIEEVEVFDFSGRKTFESEDSEVDLSGFPKGIYFLKIKANEFTSIKKVIIQ